MALRSIKVAPADGGYIISWTDLKKCDEHADETFVSKDAVRVTIEETLKLIGTVLRSRENL